MSLAFVAVFISILVAALLGGCRPAGEPALPPSSSASHLEASQQLNALFQQSDDRQMALDPIAALGRGDLRHAHRFGDYISREYLESTEARAREDLGRLASIDRQALSPADRIAFDTFQYQVGVEAQSFDSGMAQVLRHLPLDQLFGFHITFPEISSGRSLAPFNTLADYENGVKRIDGFISYLERAQSAMREGIEAGHVQPRFVTSKVLEQVEATLADGVEGSPFLGPLETFPEEITAPDRARLTNAYRAAVEERILPAYRELSEFLETEYLPASRTGAPGLIGMKDGSGLYRYLIEQHTSSRLSPEEIHQVGLAEVARLRKEMERIKTKVEFPGSLQEFFEYQRSDPRFKVATKDELLEGYEKVRRRVEPELERLFATLPQSPLEIRPVPPSLERTASGAYYFSGTPDGSRPGVFYVNTYELSARTTPTLETLFLHEAIPGHHMQVSLAQEDESLPTFMRFGANTAFIEGWALYAESLGPELGMFTDPYQYFGHLDLEMFRALRLVVDTGLHAKGWSRERAVSYMLENSSLGKPAITPEVDRYVVWPGQALAYKLGQLEIRRLRTEAEAELGGAFDIRAFHEQVLGSGTLPLPILEAKIQSWIQRTKTSLEVAHLKTEEPESPTRKQG